MHSKPCIINNLHGLCLRPPSDCELTQDSDRKNAHNLGDTAEAVPSCVWSFSRLHLQGGVNCGSGCGNGIESWCDALYRFPRDDMAASLDSSVRLNAVKGVWAKVDGVSVANVGFLGFTDFPDESQYSLGMGDGESCSPTCHHFIPVDTQHYGNVVETAGVLPGPPFGDQFLLTDDSFRPLSFGLLCFLCGSLGFALAN